MLSDIHMNFISKEKSLHLIFVGKFKKFCHQICILELKYELSFYSVLFFYNNLSPHIRLD